MSSSSSRSSSPEPPSPVLTKRKRKDVKPSEVDASDSDSSDSEVEEGMTPDEPVLSHAERRKQKKAEKLKEKEQEKEGLTSKKRKLENGKSVPVPAVKRKNSVWVGNMSFKTTQENLRTFFKDAGEVVRIFMPTKAPAYPAMKPENRGFAYVDFSTQEAKTAAIALSEQPLIGRKLLIKDGDDFTGRPAAPGADSTTTGAATHSKTAQKILRAQKQPPAPTLFLGNLGFETTEQDIRQLFEAHRPKEKAKKVDEAPSDEEGEKKDKPKDVWLRKIRMGTFEDSGACKGFSFVDFTSIEHATASLINPKNHHLNGRKLVVEYAGAEAVRRGAPKVKREEGSAPPRRRDDAPHTKRPESLTKRPERKQRQDVSWSNDKAERHTDPGLAVTEAEGAEQREERTTSTGEARRVKGPRSRPKPGAALALAKRESAAIVPSKGQKITF
ncbi:hypothetical protein D9615_000654 [Tricholomella constricta]|uniref:RRM domain-containing protein n=1 Tax=Tricholomella constricta TaxID=117010 RepID=A0A8H5HSI1_9AGAR|nr:hypothetical protein D9615_000654 [Tricholomella constricta]